MAHKKRTFCVAFAGRALFEVSEQSGMGVSPVFSSEQRARRPSHSVPGFAPYICSFRFGTPNAECERGPKALTQGDPSYIFWPCHLRIPSLRLRRNCLHS
jgi:hypothetical protein